MDKFAIQGSIKLQGPVFVIFPKISNNLKYTA